MLHPWLKDYPIKPDSKYLILGTHPPMPYCGKLQFYYGNMCEFWRFLDKVYPRNKLYRDSGCPNLKDIKKFLDNVKIAITDIVEQTDGKPFSTDENMKWTKLNSSLKKTILNSSIDVIYFTSFGGKNSALNLFKKWLKMKENNFGQISIPDSKLWRDRGYPINICNKIIQLQLLFSPSPTARRSSSRIIEYQEWLRENPNKSYDNFRIDWYKQKLPRL